MLFKLHNFLAPSNSINFHSYFLGVSVQVWPKLLLPQHACFHLVLKGHPRILRQKPGVFWWEWSKPCEVISLGEWSFLGKQAALIVSGLTGWACVSAPTSHRLHGGCANEVQLGLLPVVTRCWGDPIVPQHSHGGARALLCSCAGHVRSAWAGGDVCGCCHRLTRGLRPCLLPKAVTKSPVGSLPLAGQAELVIHRRKWSSSSPF